MRAVHRFEQIAIDLACAHLVRQLAASATFFGQFRHRVTINDRRVLAVFVIGKVPASFIEVQLSNVGCKDLIVALLSQMKQNKVLQLLTNEGAFGSPQHKSLANHFVNMKQAQFLAQHSVIAFLGFFLVL